MGIGAQKKAIPQGQVGQPAGAGPPPSSSSTASYQAPQERIIQPVIGFEVAAADAQLPPSYENSEISEFRPNVLLRPTTDNDLDYFHAIAAGENPPHLPSASVLVMNVFRSTQKHIFPLDERIALGSNINQPFYALRCSPCLTSVDEFNKLTISRRNPARGFWTDSCISEIRPRLKLLAGGAMIISDLTITKRMGMIGEKYTISWEKARDSYTVWNNMNEGPTPIIDVILDDWESMDDIPGDGGGVVRAKLRSQNMMSSHHDLAVLDATKPSLQFISTSLEGHKMMDLLVGVLVTVGVVHTRMAKLGRAAAVRMQYPPQGRKY